TQSGPWFSSADKSVLITDLSPSNIIKDKDGNYFVIDADVVYNTAARGVRVTFENSLTLNTTANQSNTTELSLAERDSEGKPVRKQYPATPGVISEARRQKAFAELNKKLREIRLGHRENLPNREALGLRRDPSTKTPPFCG
ncbi:MAG: hypothetical protein II029_01740, partial [Bacteroidales bacterium]|nr:hypothetical protein [Bacteroidales bacterium]